MRFFSHRWYGVLIVASIIGGIVGAAYTFMKNAYSQSIHISGTTPPAMGSFASLPVGGKPNYGFITGTGSQLSASMSDVTTGRLIYMCGWSVTGGGAAGRVGVIVVGGLGSEFDYDGSVAVAGGTIASEHYEPCLPASSGGSVPSVSTGAAVLGSNISINIWGYDAPIN
jgi:hypothetical protein